MGFGSLLKGIATGGLSFLPKSKNPLVGALTGYYNPFGRGRSGGGGVPVNPLDFKMANSYLNTFSPEDQANIRAGASSPGQLTDWFNTAKAAGTIPGSFSGGPMFGGGGAPALGAAPVAPAPVEQPTDYAALEEERRRRQAQRATYGINKPPMA